MDDIPSTVPSFIPPLTLDNHQLTLTPLTNYRSCHDGTPAESRIVCSSTHPTTNTPLIVKIKVQLPDTAPHPGPSTTTAHELRGLSIFRQSSLTCAPQLIHYHTETQTTGPCPGGFITYTVMTRLPGFGLFGKFWNLDVGEREEICTKTLVSLRAINYAGVEPIDRGMRNLIWDPVGRGVGVIDFEIWEEVRGTFADEKRELQRWGIVRTPPAKDHYVAFNAMYR